MEPFRDAVIGCFLHPGFRILSFSGSSAIMGNQADERSRQHPRRRYGNCTFKHDLFLHFEEIDTGEPIGRTDGKVLPSGDNAQHDSTKLAQTPVSSSGRSQLT